MLFTDVLVTRPCPMLTSALTLITTTYVGFYGCIHRTITYSLLLVLLHSGLR